MRNQYTSTFEQDYPCRAQIIRCKADRDAAPMNDYRYGGAYQEHYHLPKDKARL